MNFTRTDETGPSSSGHFDEFRVIEWDFSGLAIMPPHIGHYFTNHPEVKPDLPIDGLDIVPFSTQFGQEYTRESVQPQHLR